LKSTACKKKLYAFRPDAEFVQTYRTRRRDRQEPCDPVSLERGVRQLLSDKVSGNLVGLWLLVPEYLRLGIWDLLCGWTGRMPNTVQPRLALQLVNEAALCVNGIRQSRSLSQKGFELANGLYFVASDCAVHELLRVHTVGEAEALQVALGRIRRASGHYPGKLLALDPHHLRSYTKRQTRRHRHKENEAAVKTVATFFCLDADSGAPVAFTIGTSARTATQAGQGLLSLADAILMPQKGHTMVLADKEHCTVEMFNQAAQRSSFDLLVPQPSTQPLQRQLSQIPNEAFQSPWVGFAVATRPFRFSHDQGDYPLYQFVERCGEKQADCSFKSFVCTRNDDALNSLIDSYPKRWHLEEFFNANQALGWKRAGTLNLNIRYGQMTMALIAEAAIHQLRERLNLPVARWDAAHLAKDFFRGLEGDVRVANDTIVVTYYNAPQAQHLRPHYENLPEKLAKEKIQPQVPWLYNFKLDFRFR
jgi:hypothetical protein